MGSRGARARRGARRALERAVLEEIRAEKAAQGWIRRHARVPTTGNVMELNGELWLMSGYNITPPGLRVARGPKVALLPVAGWRQLAFDVTDGCWRQPGPGASPRW